MLENISKMKRTRSWRYTAPLRRLHTLIKGKENEIASQRVELLAYDLISLAKSQSASMPLIPARIFAANATQYQTKATASAPLLVNINKIDTEQPAMSLVTSLETLLELDDILFVTEIYKAVLGREPDSDGMKHYLHFLRDGYGKENILLEIAQSSEAQSRGLPLAGINELLAARKKFNRPIWGLVARTSHVEMKTNRLENRFWEVAGRVTAMENAFDNLRAAFESESVGARLRESELKLNQPKVEAVAPAGLEPHIGQYQSYTDQERSQVKLRDNCERGLVDGVKSPLESLGDYLIRF